MTLVRLLLCGCLIASPAASAAAARSAPPDVPRPGEEIVRIPFAPPLATPLYYRYSEATSEQDPAFVRGRVYRLVFTPAAGGYDLVATLQRPDDPPWSTRVLAQIWAFAGKDQHFWIGRDRSSLKPRGKGGADGLSELARFQLRLEIGEILGGAVPDMRVGETRETVRRKIGKFSDTIQVSLLSADRNEARYRLVFRDDDATTARARAVALARAAGQGGKRRVVELLAGQRLNIEAESRRSRETGMILVQTYRIVESGSFVGGKESIRFRRIMLIPAPEVK